MFRALIVLGALALVAPGARAQPGNLPLSPGVVPAPAFGPGMPMLGPNVATRGRIAVPFAQPFALWHLASQRFYPFGGFGYPFGAYLTPVPYVQTVPVIVEAPRAPERVVVLANEFPATLILQFPAAADVWLDGKTVDGSAADERILTSPALQAGEKHTFVVKGRWTSGGKTYEAERAVKVGAGNRTRLYILSGDEVPK